MKELQFTYFYPFMSSIPDRYYTMPKFIFEEDFLYLSSDAKILYTCLLDRLTLAVKENWKDEEDRLYVYFTLEQVMKLLGISKNTAHNVFVQLKDAGLIEVIRQGHCKPSKILVKTVMPVINFESHYSNICENED